jgi:acetyl-CoA carboxylase biotin carboxyl carrier protein
VPVAEHDWDGWLEAARHIVAAVRASDVTDFELRNCDFRIRVRRDVSAVERLAAPAPAAPPETAEASTDHLHQVVAPLTGVFFRAPSPTARPYVVEGEWVDADSVVGLIETMKIFNEVTADRSGRVVTFLAQPGQLVHAGDSLLTLEPGERTAAEPDRGL